MKPVLALITLLFGISVSVAATAEVRMQERFNVGGYLDVSRTKAYAFSPHASPRPLTFEEPEPGTPNGKAAEAARAYMAKFPANTGMMLIDNGKIIFTSYQGMGGPDREYFSMSIAKSMTSLAVGQALCYGALKSLDIRAEAIIPELTINNFGRSTIRQLLMMSSGAYISATAGQPAFRDGIGERPRTGKPYGAAAWPLRLGQVTVAELLWGFGWEKTENKNSSEPGRLFMYKAGDPMTLSKIIERLTGRSLAAYFDKMVWQKARPAKSAHWEADKDGTTIAASGFQAHPEDWARIALWVWEEHKKPGCFGDYLREATRTQISNPRLGSGAGSSFDGYGYQWWTDNKYVPGFWGKGYAGQELAINPETGKILLKFGYRNYPGVTGDLYKIYREWNRDK